MKFKIIPKKKHKKGLCGICNKKERIKVNDGFSVWLCLNCNARFG